MGSNAAITGRSLLAMGIRDVALLVSRAVVGDILPRTVRRSCSVPSAATESSRRRPRSSGWACALAG